MLNAYCKSMLNTLVKRLWLVVIAALFFGAAFGGAAYYKAKGDNGTLEEKQAAIDSYLEQVELYEQMVADSQAALDQARIQAAELQEYVDNATYMKLDGDNVNVAQIQYTAVQLGYTGWGNMINALNFYITQGGLKEDANAINPELNTKYWGELIGVSWGDNIFCVTIMQPTEELARIAMDAINAAIMAQQPLIAQEIGEFSLSVQDISYYTQTDAGIVNAQVDRRNNLKNYLTNVSDYESRVHSQKEGLKSYIENNKPDSLEAKAIDAKATAKKLALIGAFAGIWIGLGLVWLDYLAGNRIRRPQDLAVLGLNIVGSCSDKKKYEPDPSKTAVSVKQILEVMELDSVSLCIVKDHEKMPEICSGYADAFNEVGVPCKCVSCESVSAEDLQSMLSSDSVILAIRTGVTRFADAESAIKLCQLYGLKLAGAIVSR